MKDVTEFIHGHIYSDGKHTFFARKGAKGALYSVALQGVVRGPQMTPDTPGQVFGYTQDLNGQWTVSVINDPKENSSKMSTYPCPEFEAEVLPKLEDIADSLSAFMSGH